MIITANGSSGAVGNLALEERLPTTRYNQSAITGIYEGAWTWFTRTLEFSWPLPGLNKTNLA